jgi:hypothetical protein
VPPLPRSTASDPEQPDKPHGDVRRLVPRVFGLFLYSHLQRMSLRFSIVIALVGGALGVFQTWVASVVGQRVMQDLRDRLSSRARGRAGSSRGSPTTWEASRPS